MHIKELLKNQLELTLTYLNLNVDGVMIHIERPAEVNHGHLATPIALSIFSHSKKNITPLEFSTPRQLAESIVRELRALVAQSDAAELITDITIAGPGFINFTLSDQYFVQLAIAMLSPQETDLNASKTAGSLLLEYMQPNTNKPLHIGHIRNAVLGRSMGKILQRQGWSVKLATINNDRGLHIIKSMWGYLSFGVVAEQKSPVSAATWQSTLAAWLENPKTWVQPENITDERLKKPDHFAGHWYQLADAYVEDLSVQQVWSEMLITWENTDSLYHTEVRKLWQQMNDWFYEGYALTAQTLGVTFDAEQINYESEIYQAGKQLILAGAETGVFTKLPDGAIKADLSKFNLPDKIMIRRDGTGLYILQDVELLRLRIIDNPDKIVYVVGMDQKLYFQQLFAVAELLGYGKRDTYFHFAYGMVRLPEGKMSSRKGRVVYADDLLKMAQDKAREIMQQSGFAKEFPPEEFERIVTAVGVGAVKWTMLAQDPQSELTFDIAESVNFTGFAGPYIQYTLARTYSIFRKAENSSIAIPIDAIKDIANYFDYVLNQDERDVLLILSRYFDILNKSAEEFAPHHVAVYLHALAQSFNTLYAHQKIVSDNAQQTQFRLLLTKAVQKVLHEGLILLGITPVERM